LQNPDISIDEWAVIFFLTEIESGKILCSKLGWSFHGGCPFWCLVVGLVKVGGLLEIDFESQNGKLCSIGRGHMEWRKVTVLR